MKFKTPTFWYRDMDAPASLQEKILSPLSKLYEFGYKMDQARKTPVRVNIPVICMGNLVAGGAGKTLAALSIMALIKKEKLVKKPYFLSRGYGGLEYGPLKIDPKKHNHYRCGDEPLLLAQKAPTIIAKKRIAGAQFAEEKGAGCLVLDDGLQNPSLYKDLSFVVIDGTMGFGNERLLPTGPLREPLEEGFKKADAFILIGEDKRDTIKTLKGKPVFRASITTSAKKQPPKDKPYIAFAGLGYPQKFFNTLEDLRYELTDKISFPDHHRYTARDIEQLKSLAKQQKANLITTEKDHVRLSGLATGIKTLPVELSWDSEEAVIEFLKEKLSEA